MKQYKMLSPALQMQVAMVNAQIRQELGSGDYALIGRGNSAVLVGLDENEINAIVQKAAQVGNHVPTILPRQPKAIQIRG